jgi:hypothetical protein
MTWYNVFAIIFVFKVIQLEKGKFRINSLQICIYFYYQRYKDHDWPFTTDVSFENCNLPFFHDDDPHHHLNLKSIMQLFVFLVL